MARTHNLTRLRPTLSLLLSGPNSIYGPRHVSGVKRSMWRIANWIIASFQLCMALPQLPMILRKAILMDVPRALSRRQ